MNLDILKSTWYQWPSVAVCFEDMSENVTYIGIVRCRDRISGEEKAFIGLAEGQDPLKDELNIIEKGVPFYD